MTSHNWLWSADGLKPVGRSRGSTPNLLQGLGEQQFKGGWSAAAFPPALSLLSSHSPRLQSPGSGWWAGQREALVEK